MCRLHLTNTYDFEIEEKDVLAAAQKAQDSFTQAITELQKQHQNSVSRNRTYTYNEPSATTLTVAILLSTESDLCGELVPKKWNGWKDTTYPENTL